MKKKVKTIVEVQVNFVEGQGNKAKAVEILSRGYKRLLVKGGEKYANCSDIR